MQRVPAVVFVVAAVALPQAFAAEAYKVYDDFSTELNPVRWADSPRIRIVRNEKLQLAQQSYGAGDANSGLTFSSWNENLTNPLTITQLRARVTLHAIEANACPANTALAQSRARIVGSFFNVGTPAAGSQVNDVIAQVRLTRFSNYAPGLIQVQGIVVQCTNSDCTTSNPIGSVVPLGTATIGSQAIVEMRWDKGGKTFYFSRDRGMATEMNGTVGYSQSDATPPAVPFMQLSTRLDLPSCQSAPRVAGLVDAVFDNVRVNASALP